MNKLIQVVKLRLSKVLEFIIRPPNRKYVTFSITVVFVILSGYVFHRALLMDNSNYDLNTLRDFSAKQIISKIKRNHYSPPYELIYSPVKRLNYPVKTPVDWDWHIESNRSDNLYLHSWEHLNILLADHRTLGQKENIELAVPVALDWIQNNETSLLNTQDDNLAWYDMAVGVRLYRLVYIFEQSIKTDILNEEEVEIFWSSIIDHLEYLKNDENIMFHNNHGIFQAAGQAAAGRRLQSVDPKLFGDVKKEASDRLLTILNKQFTSEGVHKEHSSEYHLLAYQRFLVIREEGLVEDQQIEDLLTQAGNVLYWMIKPNGILSNIGDSDLREVPQDVEAFNKTSSENLIYYASDGFTGKRPEYNLMCFQKSGFAAVKDSDSYLGLQAAFHSRTHKHADDLAITWFDEGGDILIDSGKYGYLDKSEPDSQEYKDGFWYSDPKRMYVERTRAHNTVEIDNSDYDRVHREPYGSALKQCGQIDDGVYFIESEVEHSGGILHNRVLLFNPDDWMIVVDNFTPSDNDTHNYKQWFHFAENLKVARNGGDLIINSPDMDEWVYVDNLLEDNHSIVGPFTGQKDPYLQGWYSPDDGQFDPAPAVAIEKEQTGATSFATLLSLSKSDINVSVENSLSDQGGSFRWTEGNINWKLNYTKNESGELQVELSQQN